MGALEELEQMRMRGRGERWSGKRRELEEKGSSVLIKSHLDSPPPTQAGS